MKQWRKLNGTRIKQSITDEVRMMLMKEKEMPARRFGGGYALRACIGTDSQCKGDVIEFATVIVLFAKERVALCISIMKQ